MEAAIKLIRTGVKNPFLLSCSDALVSYYKNSLHSGEGKTQLPTFKRIVLETKLRESHESSAPRQATPSVEKQANRLKNPWQIVTSITYSHSDILYPR